MQHLVGSWPFLELDLRVDGRALVPRPETEDLVRYARERLDLESAGPVADIGTGGGCIALALAHSHPKLKILATDADVRALELARENARRSKFEDQIVFEEADLLPDGAPADLEMIVANLPYVSEEEWAELSPEVRVHDPRQALVASGGGLDLIRRLVALAPGALAPGGWLLLEMSAPQLPVLRAEISPAPWQSIEAHPDRYGVLRFLILRLL